MISGLIICGITKTRLHGIGTRTVYICSMFGLLVKFGHMVGSSGHEYSVILFLLIRLSGFVLMYLSPLDSTLGHCGNQFEIRNSDFTN